MIKHKAMEPLQIYGYMTLGAQHGPMVVVVEEARLVHCILLTTEAEAWDNARAGAGLRAPGRAAEAGGDQAPQVGGQESVRTRRGRFQLTISAGAGSSLDTAARGSTEVWA